MRTDQWFVAYTYSRSEKKVHRNLCRMGLEVYLPVQKVRRKWSDRIKIVEVPLFTSYVFVHTTRPMIPRLLGTDGIVRFLSFEKKLATVREEEMELIRRIVSEGEEILVTDQKFRKGERVLVSSGPFVGLEGILVNEHGKHRFLIQIEGLSQSISVNIPDRYLQPIRRSGYASRG
ncbi:MAG: UpxY family transcription antiterminator [Bacteroidota bacterium]